MKRFSEIYVILSIFRNCRSSSSNRGANVSANELETKGLVPPSFAAVQQRTPSTTKEKNRWGGYCNHGDILIPTWNHPYVFLLKMLTHDAAEEMIRDNPNVLKNDILLIIMKRRNIQKNMRKCDSHTGLGYLPVNLGYLTLVDDISSPTQRPYNPDGSITPYNPAGYSTVRHSNSNHITNEDPTFKHTLTLLLLIPSSLFTIVKLIEFWLFGRFVILVLGSLDTILVMALYDLKVRRKQLYTFFVNQSGPQKECLILKYEFAYFNRRYHWKLNLTVKNKKLVHYFKSVFFEPNGNASTLKVATILPDSYQFLLMVKKLDVPIQFSAFSNLLADQITLIAVVKNGSYMRLEEVGLVSANYVAIDLIMNSQSNGSLVYKGLRISIVTY
ncbi:3603_t:CDS:2 [Funneliformis geosporum]|uniref:15660_t:CDS:1 n=1 Tax=Funneliformis geosporum TaxID=1117311 RepID=A0A9W4SMC9_9GLOM|nr:3603_t:CDS:2 [Funneliformis geosporum]CAI2173543.1 15660_t:CDS:2 [Funneliformis geosporum]